MALNTTTIKRMREAGLNGARWFSNSQVRMEKPYWDANHGRFIYDRHLPSGKTVLGLNWTQGRGIFCLLAAWELCGETELLESAIHAANYIKILQIYDCPDNSRRQVAIREEVPQSWRSAPRDATEAALGLLFLYRVTGNSELLRRVVDYQQRWLVGNSRRTALHCRNTLRTWRRGLGTVVQPASNMEFFIALHFIRHRRKEREWQY